MGILIKFASNLMIVPRRFDDSVNHLVLREGFVVIACGQIHLRPDQRANNRLALIERGGAIRNR